MALAYASDPYAPPAPYHPAPAAYHPAPAPYHPAPAPYHPAPAPYHPAPKPYVEEAPKNYQYGYDVHGYDEYGNPNVHSKTETRDGYNVKGTLNYRHIVEHGKKCNNSNDSQRKFYPT